jgi:hypothetical protein
VVALIEMSSTVLSSLNISRCGTLSTWLLRKPFLRLSDAIIQQSHP